MSFNLEDIAKQFQEIKEKTVPHFQRLADEQIKLIKPEEQKNVSVNGVSCAVDRIVDNRIVIHCPTPQHAKEVFDSIGKPIKKKGFFSRIFNK